MKRQKKKKEKVLLTLSRNCNLSWRSRGEQQPYDRDRSTMIYRATAVHGTIAIGEMNSAALSGWHPPRHAECLPFIIIPKSGSASWPTLQYTSSSSYATYYIDYILYSIIDSIRRPKHRKSVDACSRYYFCQTPSPSPSTLLLFLFLYLSTKTMSLIFDMSTFRKLDKSPLYSFTRLQGMELLIKKHCQSCRLP